MSEATYKDNNLVSNKKWNKNGKLSQDFTIKDGKWSGKGINYDSDGKLISEETYKDGELISKKEY